LHDVKAALRWMRANAEKLHIDPAKIIVEGNSAGGHLALMIAGTPGKPELSGEGGNAGLDESVAAAIAFYPPVGLERRHWGGLPTLFGKDAPIEALQTASPLTYAKAGYPPTLLIQGNADDIVPAEESEFMYEALHKAGVPVELHMYANQPHAFDADPLLGRQCADIMALFIDRVLHEAEAGAK
jgi:acetyl esterase/lipase